MDIFNSHFEFTDETINWDGTTLHRIKATRDLPDHKVLKGDMGGFVAKTAQIGVNAWVFDNAKVYGYARVYGNAQVFDTSQVFGIAEVFGNAKIYDNARVFDSAWVFDTSQVFGISEVFGNAQVFGNAYIYGNAQVFGDSCVYENAKVAGNSCIAKSKHIAWGNTFTSISLSWTLTRTETGHRISIGCESGDIDHMRRLAAQDKWIETCGDAVNEARPEFNALLDMMQARINRWTSE